MRIVYDKNIEGIDYLEIILTLREIESVREFKGAVRECPYNPFNRKNKINLFVRRSTNYNSKEDDSNEENYEEIN